MGIFLGGIQTVSSLLIAAAQKGKEVMSHPVIGSKQTIVYKKGKKVITQENSFNVRGWELAFGALIGAAIFYFPSAYNAWNSGMGNIEKTLWDIAKGEGLEAVGYKELTEEQKIGLEPQVSQWRGGVGERKLLGWAGQGAVEN